MIHSLLVLNKPAQALYKSPLPHPCSLLSKCLLPNFYQPVLRGAKKALLCCPTDEHSRKPRSSQLSSPSEALWYTSPILPVQSQLWHLPCSVSFEKCSGCCRIQPGPFASSCAKENVEVVVCCRKEMSVLWYKPTSVPARPFQGHVQVVLSLVQGRLCGFSLPVQGQWDSLGFTACGCEATASAADLGRESLSVPGLPPSSPSCSWAVPGPGTPQDAPGYSR